MMTLNNYDYRVDVETWTWLLIDNTIVIWFEFQSTIPLFIMFTTRKFSPEFDGGKKIYWEIIEASLEQLWLLRWCLNFTLNWRHNCNLIWISIYNTPFNNVHYL